MSVSKGKRTIAAVMLAAAVVVLPLESVQAHRFNANSTLSIHARKKAFRGRVDSPRNSCRKNREVTVFKKKPGADKKIGSVRSIGGGYWKLRENPKNGKQYYAKVKQRKKKKHQHSHRCQAATSGTVTG